MANPKYIKRETYEPVRTPKDGPWTIVFDEHDKVENPSNIEMLCFAFTAWRPNANPQLGPVELLEQTETVTFTEVRRLLEAARADKRDFLMLDSSQAGVLKRVVEWSARKQGWFEEGPVLVKLIEDATEEDPAKAEEEPTQLGAAGQHEEPADPNEPREGDVSWAAQQES